MSKSARHLGCSSKVRYTSEEDANKVGLKVDASRMRSYYCQQCGGWHLTGHGRVGGTSSRPVREMPKKLKGTDSVLVRKNVPDSAPSRFPSLAEALRKRK